MEQPRKCSVVYHKKTPIAVFDIKTFASTKDYAAFKESCDKNLKIFEDETKKETEFYKKELALHELKIERLEHLVAYLIHEEQVEEGKVKADKTLYDDFMNGKEIKNVDYLKILKEVKNDVK